MTITITLADFEMTAPSQEALDTAWEWVNKISKDDAIAFCAQHGENILEDDNTLVEEWSEITAITKANNL